MAPGTIRHELMLCGDLMPGRGIDQVLPHPGDPALYEPHVRSARAYVALAEAAHGPIRRPFGFTAPWGAALDMLARRRPDLRIANLETAVTRRGCPEPKGINYRMTAENAPVLDAAGLDCCVIANNHVRDWGPEGLIDTRDTLEGAGMRPVGAGRTAAQAAAPAVLPLASGGRAIVFAYASPSSGTPPDWAATDSRPGVNMLPDLSDAWLERIATQVRAHKRAGDIAVFSVHWGGNWGYDISAAQKRFAHGLVDEAGIDVVFGHSSHHPKAVEVRNGRTILYGCGDVLNDYEGIGGHAAYRGDLVLIYLTGLAADGRLVRLDMVPFRIRNFRLQRPDDDEVDWLLALMDRECRRFGHGVVLVEDGTLRLAPS